MKVPYDQDWFTARDVAACLGVSRATLLRMIHQGRFPQPCRCEGQRAIWHYGVVADKIETQLHLWLGKKLLALKGYQPLGLRRPLGMSRRCAEKLLANVEKQSLRRENRRFAPKRDGGDELEKAMLREKDEEAQRLARRFVQACQDARDLLGRPLTIGERMLIYKRERPTEQQFSRFRKLLELAEDDYTRPVGLEVVTYSEPEAVLSPISEAYSHRTSRKTSSSTRRRSSFRKK